VRPLQSLFRLVLGERRARTAGTIPVESLRSPVTIRRDEHGIPYIEADNDEDAWYGLGFCQGQDRAFQIETLIRAGRGRLAEIAGKDALPMDRLSRRIGFRRIAEGQLPLLDADVRLQIEAYARGATDGARLGGEGRAHELTVLGIEPTPLEPADVLAVLAFLAFALASNWDIELARLRILRADGAEALRAVDPTYAAWHPVVSPSSTLAGAALDRLARDLTAYQSFAGTGGGSNAWVVGPSRTASGRPILSNDPHLPPALPVSWYLAHIRTPAWSICGASYVSQPSFSAGHNGFSAWGITAGHHDNTDLFLEEMGPDGRSVREGDRFVPCEVRREVIRVKGGPDVIEDVVQTPRGPIVGPAFHGEVGAISMRATWMAARPMRGFFAFNKVKSFDEFRALYSSAPCMSTSYVYADVTGKIGWTLVGEAPIRKKGFGTLPLAGWDPEVGWEDETVPFEQMPWSVDPEEGFLATANNQPVLDVDTPFLGVDWLDGYRQARIVESLAARRDWDVARTQALHLDQLSIPWRELREVILAVPARGEAARAALDLLRAFDGEVHAGSAAASVFELFLAGMIRRVAEHKAPRSAEWAMGKGTNVVLPHCLLALRRVSHVVTLLRDQPAGFLPRAWSEEMESALAGAIGTLRKKHGKTAAGWAWGRVRPLTLEHFAGDVPGLGGVFNRGPFPFGGDSATVPQASTSWLDPTGNPIGIASMRLALEVGDWESFRASTAGGQSGNPLSPHYDDLIAPWRTGEGVPIAWSPEAIRRRARATLVLQPKEKR
jgi:penicillin amidase